jgi:hypothetical protein
VRFGGIGGTITSDYVCRGTVSARARSFWAVVRLQTL